MSSFDTQTVLAPRSSTPPSTDEILVLARQSKQRLSVARCLHACLGPSCLVSTAEEISVDARPGLVVIADADADALAFDASCHAADAAVLWLTDRLDCPTAETVREQGGICLEISTRQPTALRQAVALATRQHRLLREQRRTRAELEQTQADFGQLLTLLSDEGGRNLTLLKNAVTRLRDQLADSLTVPLVRVEAHTERLAGWLDDLVRLAHVGQSPRQPRWTDPAFVIDEALFDLHELVQDRDVEVLVRRPMPALWCDADSIRQMVTALLENAILHGCDPQRARVTVWTELAMDERGRRVTVLRVADNGSGIDPDYCEKIFQAGYRLGSSSLGTSGLGLALVRRIARHYGGTAGIEMSGPQGTIICVALPTPDITLRPAGPTLVLPPGANCQGALDRDEATRLNPIGDDRVAASGAAWDPRHRPHHRQAPRRDMAF